MKISVRIRGARDTQAAERAVTTMIKRALFMVDGIPGSFGALIEAPGGSIELDRELEWRKVTKPAEGLDTGESGM